MLSNLITKELNENFNEVAPHCFFYEVKTEKSKKMSETLRAAYFPFDIIDNRTHSSLSNVRLYNDALMM